MRDSTSHGLFRLSGIDVSCGLVKLCLQSSQVAATSTRAIRLCTIGVIRILARRTDCGLPALHAGNQHDSQCQCEQNSPDRTRHVLSFLVHSFGNGQLCAVFRAMQRHVFSDSERIRTLDRLRRCGKEHKSSENLRFGRWITLELRP